MYMQRNIKTISSYLKPIVASRFLSLGRFCFCNFGWSVVAFYKCLTVCRLAWVTENVFLLLSSLSSDIFLSEMANIQFLYISLDAKRAKVIWYFCCCNYRLHLYVVTLPIIHHSFKNSPFKNKAAFITYEVHES